METMIFRFLTIALIPLQSSAEIGIHENRNLSDMAIGEDLIAFSSSYVKKAGIFSCAALSEISRALKASGTITILNIENKNSLEFNEFIMEIHRLRLQTCIFNESESFFKFIGSNLKGYVEVTALVFHNPNKLIPQVNLH